MGLSGHRRAYCMMLLGLQTYYESPVRPPPEITRYHQFSACRQEMRSSSGIRGSGGVACFVRDYLQRRISLVAIDEFARFMWVRVWGVSPLPRDIYIVVCYFPPTSSSYAIPNGLDGGPLYRPICRHHPVHGD
jgi:hypothetical protein